MFDELFEADRQTAAKVRALRPYVPEAPEGPGIWSGMGKGSGMGLMKGFAEVGRNAAMAAAVPALVVDAATERASSAARWLTGMDLPRGTSLADTVFEQIDETFNPAVKFWEAKPEEVGAAGQVLGALANMGSKAMIGGASGLVANEQLSMSIELAQKGASTAAAVAGGVTRGTTTAIGLAIPAALGPTRLTSAAIGAAVNPVIGIADRAALSGILSAEGLTKAAQEYRPFDPVQLSVDAAFGAVFGAIFKTPAPKKAKPGVVEAPAIKGETPLLREAAQTALLHSEAEKGRLTPPMPFDAAESIRLNAEAEARAIAGEAPMIVHPDTPIDVPALKDAQERAAAGLRSAEKVPEPYDIRGITVYHGTTAQFDQFTDGMFTSNKERATNYALGSKGRVIEAQLDIRNPMPWKDAFGKTPEEIKAAGFDGTVQWGGNGEVMRAIVVDPAQVRPAGRPTDGHLFAVQDIPTVDAMRQAMDLVGEAEFTRRANARIAAHKGDLPHGESTLIEAEAREILAADRAAQGMPEPLTTQIVDMAEFDAAVRGEPAPPARPPQIEAAQRAAEQMTTGKSLQEIISDAKLPPEVRNLVVGLAEAQGSPARAARMLDDFARTMQVQQPGRSATDIAADVVEASRAGRTATPEPQAVKATPEIEAARLAVAERPDARIPVGLDDQGNTLTRKASDALADVEREFAQAQTDAKAFLAAANCFLRG